MNEPRATASPAYDVIIAGGLFFDGSGAPGVVRHVGLLDGRVETISDRPLAPGPATEVIDATGRWVLPGLVDVHTHYDAELLVGPGLTESVRHGVTTVFTGNCSLSTIYSSAVDVADLFSRVEALPRDAVINAVETHKTWTTPAEWIEVIERLPLGPNIASFLGHSDLRASVMGLGRSTDRTQKPSRSELRRMTRALEDALDAGFLGISTMTNPWDKLDGDRYRSRSLPSTYARWSEFRKLHKVLRRRDAVLQSIPNLNTRYDMAFFLAASTGIGRKPLKTSLLAAADPKSARLIHRLFGPMAYVANTLGRGQFRWQHLPTRFDVYSDGIDLVVFEEFGSGRAALHLQDGLGRDELLADEGYRQWFRDDFAKKFTPRVWHRDFEDAHITECPDASLVGRSVADVAAERGLHVVDAFLDLVLEHGRAMRWHTTVANDRPARMNWLANQPGVTIGFSDAGAHLRNMAFYNFGIRFLQRVHAAAEEGKPFMSLEKAVWKLTGEPGEFYGIDAGRLAEGGRADLVVIDPAGLVEHEVNGYHEAVMAEFDGISRMVNRNDDAVVATVISGRVVYRSGTFEPGYGSEFGTGQFLRTSTVTPARVDLPATAAVAG